VSGPRLSFAIPSWNGADALEAHLPSVLEAAARTGGAEVVVADDASTDDTADRLRRAFPEVRRVPRRSRGGFAPAANAAVAAARGEMVLLLNNDMEVAPDAAALLVEALDADPRLFAVVPSIVRSGTGEEEAGTRLQFRRGTVATALHPSLGLPPAYACGGAMLVRKADFSALGGFDPLFAPFYWEDVDLSYRARKRGRTLACVPRARVVHDHGRTIGARFTPHAVSRVYERNRLLFTWKNLTDGDLWARHLALLPVKALWDVGAHPVFVKALGDAVRLRRQVASRRAGERSEAGVADRALLTLC
jgi:GT2 family glycosyltransferase